MPVDNLLYFLPANKLPRGIILKIIACILKKITPWGAFFPDFVMLF
jgi:hypothetical protein